MTTQEATQAWIAWGIADDKLQYAEEKLELLTELCHKRPEHLQAPRYSALVQDMRIEAHKVAVQARWRAARASALAQEASEQPEAKWAKNVKYVGRSLGSGIDRSGGYQASRG